jgi:hypothetical protein
MSRNGSGTYNLPAGNPVVTGTTISSTWANNTLTDIATALTGSIASDGQTVPSANLPMGGYGHTGVASATTRTMYATSAQVQDGVFTYLTSVSGTNTLTATASVLMNAYVAGQVFYFLAPNANTGAVTININSIGAKSIYKEASVDLVNDDIIAGSIVTIIYDGTNFQLASSSGTGGGASGGGGDEIFYENDQTVTTTYSIPSGKNASTTGPITIDSGVTITVPSGSRWIVL